MWIVQYFITLDKQMPRTIKESSITNNGNAPKHYQINGLRNKFILIVAFVSLNLFLHYTTFVFAVSYLDWCFYTAGKSIGVMQMGQNTFSIVFSQVSMTLFLFHWILISLKTNKFILNWGETIQNVFCSTWITPLLLPPHT